MPKLTIRPIHHVTARAIRILDILVDADIAPVPNDSFIRPELLRRLELLEQRAGALECSNLYEQVVMAVEVDRDANA